MYMYGIKEYEKIPEVSIGTLGNRYTSWIYINSMAGVVKCEERRRKEGNKQTVSSRRKIALFTYTNNERVVESKVYG